MGGVTKRPLLSPASLLEKSTKQPQLLTCTSETSCWTLSFFTVTLTDHLSRFPFAESTLLFPDIHCPLVGQDLLGEIQLPGRIEEMGQAGGAPAVC